MRKIQRAEAEPFQAFSPTDSAEDPKNFAGIGLACSKSIARAGEGMVNLGKGTFGKVRRQLVRPQKQNLYDKTIPHEQVCNALP